MANCECHNQMVTISVGFLRISTFGGIAFQPGPTGTGRGDAHSGDPTGTMAVAQVKVLFNEPILAWTLFIIYIYTYYLYVIYYCWCFIYIILYFIISPFTL